VIKMKIITFIALIGLMGLCPLFAVDDIGDLLAGLDTSGMWMNGLCRTINLPLDALPEKILNEIVPKKWRGDQNNADQFRDWHLAEMRKVKIPGAYPPDSPAYAALIISARGSKTIVLMLHQNLGWWNRTFFVTTVP